MKQKLLSLCFIIFIVLCFEAKAAAQTIGVESMCDFSTSEPPQSITVQLIEPVYIDEIGLIDSGSRISGDLIDVKSPKRLKQNASFSFKPTSYVLDNKVNNISQDIIAPYTVPVDKLKLTKNVALGVGGFFVKGLSMGVAAVEGAVKDEQDNRLKSTVKSAFEASPVSYVEKGKDINIKKGQVFYLKFPDVDSDLSNQNSDKNN